MGKKKQEAILFGIVISNILITSSLSSISSQVIEEVRAQNMTNQTTTNVIANQTDVDNATATTITTPLSLPPPCCPSDGYIANAGPDQTVLEGTIITLNGSGNNKSNNIGNMVNYLWRQTDGPAIILNGNNTANPTFVAPNYPNNTKYTFALEVFENQVNNNNQTGSAIDTVDIIVNDANIEAKSPGSFQEGDDTTEEQSDQDELQDDDEEVEEEETEEQAEEEEEEEGNEDE